MEPRVANADKKLLTPLYNENMPKFLGFLRQNKFEIFLLEN